MPVLLGLPIMLCSRTCKVGLIGYAMISFEADEYGSGIHMWNVTKQDVTEYAKVSRLGLNDMRNLSVADEDLFVACECLTDSIWTIDIHDQALDIIAVPSGFHPQPDKQNFLLRSSFALDELFLLSDQYFNQDSRVYATIQNMDAGNAWTLYQHGVADHRCRNHQCSF